MAPRRTRFVLWSLGAFLVLALGAAIAVHLTIESRWSRFVAEVEALEAEVARFRATRPVLWGEAVDGEAWDVYESSSAKLSTLNEETRLACLASLRSGAHRASIRKQGVPSQTLQDLALQETKSRLAAGQPEEAARWLLDAFQFGRDTWHPGRRPRLHQPINQCHSFLRTARWPAEVLETLGVGFRILDESLPGPNQDRAGYLAAVARTLLDSELATWDWRLRCRYFGSLKLIKVEAFEGHQHLSSLEHFPGPYDPIALGRAEDISTRNPFMYGLEPDFWLARSVFEPCVLAPRLARAQLRLLRLAVAALRNDPLPALEDPFTGKPLLAEPGPRPRKFWSAGANFVDDGGSGDFSGSGKDLVLELPR